MGTNHYRGCCFILQSLLIFKNSFCVIAVKHTEKWEGKDWGWVMEQIPGAGEAGDWLVCELLGRCVSSVIKVFSVLFDGCYISIAIWLCNNISNFNNTVQEKNSWNLKTVTDVVLINAMIACKRGKVYSSSTSFHQLCLSPTLFSCVRIMMNYLSTTSL